MILIIYSNINGLLGWEDFALKGAIKFQDYGFLIAISLLFFGLFQIRKQLPDYVTTLRKMPLYNAINVYWIYYVGLFIFSVLIQGSILWPVKMARVFFYGLIFYVICRELLPNPLAKFEKIINCLMVATIFFGLLYIAYNTLGWDIYPKGEHESFNLGYLVGEVKRNFSGFPMFAFYFIFLFTERLMTGKGSKLFNLSGLVILLLCLLFMLTRGTLILTVMMAGFLVVYRPLSLAMLTRLSVLAVLLLLALALVPYVAEGHYMAMMRRFDEFSNHGLASSSNFVFRINELERIIKNVMDFNPFFGFGFTVVWAFGYTSNLYHAGSADNGFSNLIGVTGFVGLAIFMVVISCWIIVNRKLQVLEGNDGYARVHFIFCIFMLGSFMNGASMSYMHTFALFIAYDLMAYAYRVHARQQSPKSTVATNCTVLSNKFMGQI
ncbi:MAG: O-antigen ligase family protein [Azonexus sp.]|nr:O-antigen ligase family protein [Azonexus sp.]